MTIRERIAELHLGQVVIVVLVAAMVTGLLVLARRPVAGDKGLYALLAWRLQERIDSLYGREYLARRLLRLHSPSDTSDPFIRLIDSIDEQYDVPSEPLVLKYLENTDKRDQAAAELIALNLAIATVVGLCLGLLWVWFGGRNKPIRPARVE